MLAVVSLNHVKSGTTTDDPYETHCTQLHQACGGIFSDFQKFQPDRGWAKTGETCDTNPSHVQCTDWIRAVANGTVKDPGYPKYGPTKACFTTHLVSAKNAHAALGKGATTSPALERECKAAAGAINTVDPKSGFLFNGTNDCMSCDDLLDLQCGAADNSDQRISYVKQQCGCAPQH